MLAAALRSEGGGAAAAPRGSELSELSELGMRDADVITPLAPLRPSLSEEQLSSLPEAPRGPGPCLGGAILSFAPSHEKTSTHDDSASRKIHQKAEAALARYERGLPPP